ncbi:MAG: molecular chaperone DnaK, partial [Candidatus Eremiobacteraeota bacterium]|nr:molecular chaperone DnaK [Candidatus Eremiobacteraeota bacterium]
RMVRDAEAFAAADKAKKEDAEIRNTASSLIYSTEKSLKEVGDKAEAGVRGDVETALTELKKISENGSAEEIKAATEKLQQASYKMAETLYKSTGASTEDGAADGAGGGHHDGASANGASAPNEDVIDAEFKEAK